MPLVTLQEAKDQCRVDAGLTQFDAELLRHIGASEDWAQNFTQRPLGELMELSVPADEDAVPLPDVPYPDPAVPMPTDNDPTAWKAYWEGNPALRNRSASLRRDVKAAILMQVEILFDRNVDNFTLLNERSHDLLRPYRLGMGL